MQKADESFAAMRDAFTGVTRSRQDDERHEDHRVQRSETVVSHVGPMAVSESTHRDGSFLPFHHHGVSFATIVLEGSYVEVREGMPWVHSAGSVVLHSADEEHADYFTSAGRCLNVEIAETSAAVAVDVLASDRHCRRAACDIVRAVSAGARARELQEAVGKLRASLDGLATAPQEVLPVWMATIIDRFPWTTGGQLNEAAKLAGVHPVHFSREFQRYMRMTPTVFRRRARVRRATQLLLLTNARLASVALECGFSDQSHFTREFRLATGLAPDSFRRTFAR